MKLLDSMWFTAMRGSMGIVRVQGDYDGIKYYIGNCCAGNTEDEDAELIMEFGARFPSDAGDVLFGIEKLS